MKKKGCLVKLILGVVIILLLVAGYSKYNEWRYQSRFTWPQTGLTVNLPDPDTNKGYISDNDYMVDITVNKYSGKDYEKYAEQCRDKGFTYEAAESQDEYTAYNEKGMRLVLSYSSFTETMYIEIYDNPAKEKYTWPSTGIAGILPVPESHYGIVVTDSESNFHIYVGKTDHKAYGSYVEKCLHKGFNHEYNKDKTSFHGEDKAGNTVYVNDLGMGNMEIHLIGASEEEEEEIQEEEVSSSSEEDDEEEIDEEFAALMEQYEDFIDEYIEFMEEYRENDNPGDMFDAYSDYLDEYTETMEALDEIDEDELNSAELKLYSETMLHISEKLAEAGV